MPCCCHCYTVYLGHDPHTHQACHASNDQCYKRACLGELSCHKPQKPSPKSNTKQHKAEQSKTKPEKQQKAETQRLSFVCSFCRLCCCGCKWRCSTTTPSPCSGALPPAASPATNCACSCCSRLPASLSLPCSFAAATRPEPPSGDACMHHVSVTHASMSHAGRF